MGLTLAEVIGGPTLAEVHFFQLVLDPLAHLFSQSIGTLNRLKFRHDLLRCADCSPSLAPGKHLHNYGNSLFLMGKLSISMAIFNGYVTH